jgi:hypothetical protein
VDVDYDAGETVGWLPFAATVAAVRAELPAAERVVVLTGNYGQAGAVDRFLPELAPAYSGHNAYSAWGPPPEEVTTVIAIGIPADELRRWFGRVTEAARIDDGVGLENDEQGTRIRVAADRRLSWATIWPQLRHLG